MGRTKEPRVNLKTRGGEGCRGEAFSEIGREAWRQMGKSGEVGWVGDDKEF